MQEIHFKPPDQARQPTFASEKSDGDGREETVEVIHIIDIKGRGLRPSIRDRKGKRGSIKETANGVAVIYKRVSCPSPTMLS